MHLSLGMILTHVARVSILGPEAAFHCCTRQDLEASKHLASVLSNACLKLLNLAFSAAEQSATFNAVGEAVASLASAARMKQSELATPGCRPSMSLISLIRRSSVFAVLHSSKGT